MRRVLAFAMLAGCTTAPKLAHPDVVAAILARVDADHDGRVSAAEYEPLAMTDEPLATYDLDADGVLDAIEVEKMFLGASPTALTKARMQALRDGPPGRR